MIRSTVTRSIRQGYARPLSRRTLPTPLLQQSLPSIIPNATAGRTLFTRAKPTIGSRSRSFVTRVGLAVAFIWWYNTGGVWAEEPVDKQPVISRAPPVAPVPEERFASLDELEAERKKKREQKKEEKKGDGASETAVTEIEGGRSPESLEEEAGQQGAFNEETGEINWDCPCLGGMAHGPCGEEFRAAFSCFVFSKEEPKGVDCIEKFKGMQTCFQKYPEIYGDPPADDDDDEEDEIDRKIAELDDKDSSKPSAPSSSGKPSKEPTSTDSSPRPAPETKGTEEYSHDAPKDNADSKDGTLSHPGPGEKGIGGGSHEGPVDTDAATAGLIRPAPSSSGVDGAVKGHGAPGVKGVGGATGPEV